MIVHVLVGFIDVQGADMLGAFSTKATAEQERDRIIDCREGADDTDWYVIYDVEVDAVGAKPESQVLDMALRAWERKRSDSTAR